MPTETVRVAKFARDQLIGLKRHTKIENWNVLCRWAFCVSLAEPTVSRVEKLITDSPVEMTWKTFSGDQGDLYWCLLIERCKQDGIELTEENLQTYFRLHLHRGVAYLAGDRGVKSIAGLIQKAVEHT